MRRPTTVVVCDVAALPEVDLSVVEALARAQLHARRMDCEIRLRGACPRLRALIRLVALEDVLPLERS